MSASSSSSAVSNRGNDSSRGAIEAKIDEVEEDIGKVKGERDEIKAKIAFFETFASLDAFDNVTDTTLKKFKAFSEDRAILRNALELFLGGDKSQLLLLLNQQLAGYSQQLAELHGTLKEYERGKNALRDEKNVLLASLAASDQPVRQSGESLIVTLLQEQQRAQEEQMEKQMEGITQLLSWSNPGNRMEQMSELSGRKMEALATTVWDDAAFFFRVYFAPREAPMHQAPTTDEIEELSKNCKPRPEVGKENVQELVEDFFENIVTPPVGSVQRREANVRCDRTHHGGDDTRYTPAAHGYVDHVWIPSSTALSYVAKSSTMITCPILGLCEDKCGLEQPDPRTDATKVWNCAVPQFKAHLLAAVEMNTRRVPSVKFPVPGALTNGTLWKFGIIFLDTVEMYYKVVMTGDLNARKDEDLPLITQGIAWLHRRIAYNAIQWERARQASLDDAEDGDGAGGDGPPGTGSNDPDDAEGGGSSDCENHGGGPPGKATGGGGAVPQGSRPQGAGGYTAQLSTAALAARNRCAPTRPPNPVDRFWPPFPQAWE